ncbi:flavodoxin family protein [Anaerocolumna xylanovorans]|uniref:NADPH-dependent FMN reductase n=1 Tax=Anaerocolumna xylanovorans DSM 12503 TaxID=1121345 RepID=A0A1M7YKB9_9FIRM|nr:flavodoxin family protein [Anaerocolumna xylanovorans]SHO53016.1 NADPH-dependent FMN reductase [Anaerocolumna xylanovorans DSM 12503]
MKKVIALIGSQQKRGTYDAVLKFGNYLKSYGEIEFEYIFLHDYNLEYCRGCKLCFDKGEEYCPLKDDRDILIDKISHSDGVIFASPNYSFHISARMKNMFDRLAFIFHRPRFFGKACTAIVTQGIYGGNKIVKYLNAMGENLGFHAAKGCVLATLEPGTEAMRRKNDRRIKKAASAFYKELMRTTPSPSIFRLMLFRLSRTSMSVMIDEAYRDFRYYQEKGWFKSDYYYETSLGPVKKAVGHFFDFLGRKMSA